MSRAAVNGLLVLGACVLYIALGLMSGRTSVNGGLGIDGPIYAAMVADHDLQRGSAVNKLTPAFPAVAAIPYSVSRNVIGSFALVNLLAFGVLVFAACAILDVSSAALSVKAAVALTLALLGTPSRIAAFDPGQPYLLGVALIALAVAACEWEQPALTAGLHIGATLASPIGLIAPLYGIARAWRLGRRPESALAVFAPALLVWVAVQYWARGGVGGLIDLMRLSRVRSDATFWTESPFIIFGAYFLVTSLGGLTLLLWSRPAIIKEAMLERTELFALVVPVVPFILTGGLHVPWMMMFLLPFWFLVVAAWVRRSATPMAIPIVLAVALTIVTQHPWVRLDDMNYFVDWFPYSVYAERVGISAAGLAELWRIRVFIAAAGIAAFVAWARATARRQRSEAPAR